MNPKPTSRAMNKTYMDEIKPDDRLNNSENPASKEADFTDSREDQPLLAKDNQIKCNLQHRQCCYSIDDKFITMFNKSPEINVSQSKDQYHYLQRIKTIMRQFGKIKGKNGLAIVLTLIIIKNKQN